MKISDLAKSVGVPVSYLAECLGVTRQALYQEETKMTPKVKQAILKLYELNDERCHVEQAAVLEKHEEYDKMIQAFTIQIRGGVVENG